MANFSEKLFNIIKEYILYIDEVEIDKDKKLSDIVKSEKKSSLFY